MAAEPMTTATAQAGQVVDTAKTETQAVAAHATDAATSVMDTARQHAGDVAVEASSQAEELMSQAQQHLAQEGERQTSRLAENLRRLAGELSTMAGAGSDETPLPSLLQQLAGRGNAAADFLDTHGPDGLLRELQNYGRRRPGAFLASAAAAGFAATRMLKHTAEVKEATADRRPTGTGRTTTGRASARAGSTRSPQTR